MLILQVIGCYQLRRPICTWCTLNQQHLRHFVKHSQPFLDQLIRNFTIAVFSFHSASSLIPRSLAVLKVWGRDYSACLFAFASFTWLALHLNFLRLLFVTPLCLALCHYFFGTAVCWLHSADPQYGTMSMTKFIMNTTQLHYNKGTVVMYHVPTYQITLPTQLYRETPWQLLLLVTMNVGIE